MGRGRACAPPRLAACGQAAGGACTAGYFALKTITVLNALPSTW